MSRACPGHKHLGKSFRNVRFIATVPLKRLRVELTRPVSGHVDVLEPTCGSHQIARVGAIAVPFAFRARLSPGCSNELVELFTHHRFEHDPHGALRQRTQVLMEECWSGNTGDDGSGIEGSGVDVVRFF